LFPVMAFLRQGVGVGHCPSQQALALVAPLPLGEVVYWHSLVEGLRVRREWEAQLFSRVVPLFAGQVAPCPLCRALAMVLLGIPLGLSSSLPLPVVSLVLVVVVVVVVEDC